MIKKCTSFILIGILLFSVFLTSANAEAITPESKIYFSTLSEGGKTVSGWERAGTVYCHIRNKETGEIFAYGSKNEQMKKESENLYSYDLSEHNASLESDKTYEVVFFNNESQGLTYDLLISSECFGDTVKLTGESILSPYDGEKFSDGVKWSDVKNSEKYGMHLAITPTGKIVGETLLPDETNAQVIADWLNENSVGVDWWNMPDILNPILRRFKVDKAEDITDKLNERASSDYGVSYALGKLDYLINRVEKLDTKVETNPKGDFAPDSVIVMLTKYATESIKLGEAEPKASEYENIRSIEPLTYYSAKEERYIYLFNLKEAGGQKVIDAINSLMKRDEIYYAEPNYISYIDDPVTFVNIPDKLTAGKTAALKVTNGTVKSWKSSNSKVAVVKNGKVTALKKGSATITATLTNGKKLTCKLTVKTNPTIKIGKNKFNKKTAYTIKKNGTLTVKVTGKAVSVKNKYSTTKKKIAKVISKSTAKTIKIKGYKKGTAKITIKVNGVAFKIKVKVK